MAANKYYVVWKGRKPGIYETWEECREQVDKHQGAEYKGYRTLEDAAQAYRDGPGTEIPTPPPNMPKKKSRAEKGREESCAPARNRVREYSPEAKSILERLCGPGHDKDPRD